MLCAIIILVTAVVVDTSLFWFNNFTDIGFTQSEYIIRESVMNHTIPVRITGGRLPVATSVQVQAEGNTMDTPGMLYMTIVSK